MDVPSKVLEPSQEELDFEMSFYQYIAGGEHFELIPIPYPLGYYLNESEQKYLIKQAHEKKIKLIFRIEKGDTAVVFDFHGNKTAVVPNSDNLADGFLC